MSSMIPWEINAEGDLHEAPPAFALSALVSIEIKDTRSCDNGVRGM